MDGGHIGHCQQRLEAFGARNAHFGRARIGQVLAPCDHLDTKGPGQGRHIGAQPPQPDQAQRQPLQIAAGIHLPTAARETVEITGQIAARHQDQGHRKLCCRRGPAGRAADRDAAGAGHLHVDRQVTHPRRHDQPQIGQRRDQIGGQGRALAHHAKHIIGGERCGQFRRRDRRVKHGHVTAQIAPIGVAVAVA